MPVCCAKTFKKTKQPAGILNKLNQVDTLVYLLMSTCCNRFLNRFQAPGKIWKDEVDAFCRCEAELSVIQDLGEKFANSEPDALKQQHFLPKSKGCPLLVYSTTEVQINHLHLQRSPKTRTTSIAHLICHLDSMLKTKLCAWQEIGHIYSKQIRCLSTSAGCLGSLRSFSWQHGSFEPACEEAFFSAAQLPAYIPWGLVW